MSNQKKVFSRELSKIYRAQTPPPMQLTYLVQDEQIRISVKPRLSLSDMLDFVHDVVWYCFQSDAGEYCPQLKEFAIAKNTLEKYTNIKLPSSTKKIYDIIYGTDILTKIKSLEHFDHAQYATILMDIDRLISFRLDQYLKNRKEGFRDIDVKKAIPSSDKRKDIYPVFPRVSNRAGKNISKE